MARFFWFALGPALEELGRDVSPELVLELCREVRPSDDAMTISEARTAVGVAAGGFQGRFASKPEPAALHFCHLVRARTTPMERR